MRKRWATALPLVAALAGCSAAAPEPAFTPTSDPALAPEFTATVKLELLGKSSEKLYNVYTKTDSSCTGTGGYDDLGYKDEAEITDEDELSASGTGRVTASEITPTGCLLTYQFPEVQPGMGTYLIHLGHRAPREASEKELREGVELSTGS